MAIKAESLRGEKVERQKGKGKDSSKVKGKYRE